MKCVHFRYGNQEFDLAGLIQGLVNINIGTVEFLSWCTLHEMLHSVTRCNPFRSTRLSLPCHRITFTEDEVREAED